MKAAHSEADALENKIFFLRTESKVKILILLGFVLFCLGFVCLFCGVFVCFLWVCVVLVFFGGECFDFSPRTLKQSTAKQ